MNFEEFEYVTQAKSILYSHRIAKNRTKKRKKMKLFSFLFSIFFGIGSWVWLSSVFLSDVLVVRRWRRWQRLEKIFPSYEKWKMIISLCDISEE